jgi:putative DNA primase/helicase
MGLEGGGMSEAEVDRTRPTPPDGEIGRTLFVYRGTDRQPLLYVVRPAPDAPHRPDGDAEAWGPASGGRGWQPNLDHLTGLLPLYRLGAVTGDAAAAVIFHPSERDVYRATMAGLAGVHTTTVLGAGCLHRTDLSPLRGRNVAVVAADLGPGGAYAEAVANRAREAGARRVVTVRLDEPLSGAATEAWLHAGGTAPAWTATLEAAGIPARPSADPLALSQLARASQAEPAPAVLSGVAPAAEPSPLPAGRAPSDRLDLETLPEPFRAFVASVAARAGCAPDLPAAAVMVALAAVTGRALRVRPDPGAAETVVPNLWGALVTDAPVAAGSAVAGVLSALDHLESRAHSDFTQAQATWRARRAAYRTAVQAWRRRVRESPPERHALGALAAVYPEPPERPRRRRHQTATGRMDALVGLLNANPAGLLLRADDLGAWLKRLTRAGNEGERHFLLRCWDGAAPGLDYDGPEGESLHCDHPCLSVLGWTSPDACRRLLAHPETGPAAAALLGRFALLVVAEGTTPAAPASEPAPEPGADGRGRALQVFERLEAYLRPGAAPVVPFTPAAAAHGLAWREALEARSGGSGPMAPYLAAHLAAQRKAMPALGLLIHAAEQADRDRGPEAVPLAAAERATAWCDLLIAHARRLHGAEAPAVNGARTLLERIAAGELPSPFTVRDVYRRHWTGLGSPDAARAAVAVLERHAYLAAEPVPTTARGGKPTRRYHVHPQVRAQGPGASLATSA